MAALAFALCGQRVVAAAQELDAEPEATASSEPPAQPEITPPFRAALGAGLGIGLRDIGLPTPAGERRLQSGLFPALDVDLRAEHAAGEHFLLGVRMRYQTSLGLAGRETPYSGTTRESAMRVHHGELGVEPAFRLGRSADSVSIGMFAGWALRALRTETGLSVPDYSVHGPVARLELRVPLRGRDLSLRVAPELMAWLSTSGALRAAGALDPAGLALGGEASLDIGIARGWGVALTYRGSRGSIPSALGGSLVDTEHFLTLQLALIY